MGLELSQIGERLSDYFCAPLRELKVLASGWETTVFEFALARRDRFGLLPVARPLVLRLYQSQDADAKARREYCAVKRLFAAGVPVPEPYLLEMDGRFFDAPFMVMERLAGSPLLQTDSFRRALQTFSQAFLSFVRTHAALHRLNVREVGFDQVPKAFPPREAAAEASLIDRVLAAVAEKIEVGPLPHLRPALERTWETAARFRAAPLSVLHLDYHPFNIIVKGFRVTGIIDWVFADCGDRHLDVATSAVILSSSVFEQPRWLGDNPMGNLLRRFYCGLYIALYHSILPLDFERFRYCQAVASLQRLSMLGVMRRRGAASVGFRPEAVSDVTPGTLKLLSRYAARKTGVAVPVPGDWLTLSHATPT